MNKNNDLKLCFHLIYNFLSQKARPIRVSAKEKKLGHKLCESSHVRGVMLPLLQEVDCTWGKRDKNLYFYS